MYKPGIFFIFENVLGTKELQKIYEIAGSFFQALLSTIFYKRSCTFHETLKSLAYTILSEKQLVSVSR